MEPFLKYMKKSSAYKGNTFPFIIKILLFLFFFIFVFASMEPYLATERTIFFYNTFMKGIAYGQRFFSIFEIYFVFIIIVLSFRFKLRIHNATRFEKVFLFFIIANFVLKILNPNSNPKYPVLGLPFLENLEDYLFLLLWFFIAYSSKKDFAIIIKNVFSICSILIILRAITDYFIYFSGGGSMSYSSYYGVASILTESDTLLFMSFFESIFWGLFLLTRRKKYFLSFLLLLSLLLLSYRRTALMIALMADTLILMVYTIKIAALKQKPLIIIGLSIILVLFTLILSYPLLPTNIERYVRRYTAVIPFIGQDATVVELSDTGHWRQTRMTILSAIEKLGFWGGGYGNFDKYELEGQSSSIHNVYAAAWAYHGLFYLIFILFLFFLLVQSLLKRYLLSKHRISPASFYKICLLIFLICYFIGMAFTAFWIFDSFKMSLFWSLILASIYKLDDRSFELYLIDNG